VFSNETSSNGSSAARARARQRRQIRIASFRELRSHWREDFEVNGRKLMQPGFQAVAVYRLGVRADSIENPLGRRLLKLLYVPLHLWVRNVYGIELPHQVQAGRRLRIGHQSGIVVHRSVRFGDDCLLRQNVTIGIARDDTPPEEAPVLGDRVQIGAGAVVLSPARIGDDVTVGPNVVVRDTIPSGSVVLPPPPIVQDRRRPVLSGERARAR